MKALAERAWNRMVDWHYVAGHWTRVAVLVLPLFVVTSLMTVQSRHIFSTLTTFVIDVLLFGAFCSWALWRSDEQELSRGERGQVATAARAGTSPADHRLAKAVLALAAKVEERDGRLASGEARRSESVLRCLRFILVPALMAYWVWDARSSVQAGHWTEVVSVLFAMALVAWLSVVLLSDAIRENRRRELCRAAAAAREVLVRHEEQGQHGDEVEEAGAGPTASNS